MVSLGTVVDRGLEGVVVGTSAICNVDGAAGRLRYRGYDIADLAERASFEEVAFLLLFGRLPNAPALADFTVRLAANRAMTPGQIAALKVIPRDAWPMDVLRTAVSALSLTIPTLPDGSHASNTGSAIHVIARMPTIVAAWDRIRRGLEPIAPEPQLSTAANFLYMRSGRVPEPEAERALDTYLVLLADHSYNASTFAARVAASTRADLFAAATAALATLQGDLHGGAPSRVMATLVDIGTPDRAESYVREMLARGERVMGMGHREYRVRDPRAAHLESMARALAETTETPWYAIARALEDAANAAFAEKKPGRKIFANVEFYTAPTLHALGIPADEFTCLFACGRIVGWAAHVLEQLADNRLIRPQATYTGPDEMTWTKLEARSAS